MRRWRSASWIESRTTPARAAVALAAELAELDEPAVARVKAIVARAGDPAAALAEEAAGNRGWTGTLPPR